MMKRVIHPFLPMVQFFLLFCYLTFHQVIRIVDSVNYNDNNHRQLQSNDSDRLCDEFIGIVSADEIKELGRIHLQPYYASSNDPSLIETSLEIIYLPAKFNVAVYKSCSSCEMIDQIYIQRLQLLPAYHTNGYCNQIESLAYRSIHSSLVMIPLDPAFDISAINTTTTTMVNDALLHGYTMRAFMSLRPTRLNYSFAPTEFFPPNLTSFIEANESNNNTASIRQLIVDYAPSLLAASSGSIGIVPDYLGFGTSTVTSNRTFLLGTDYEVAGAIGFLGTRELITNKTNNCSSVDMQLITIQGVDDGAYGASFISYALRQFDIETTTLFLSGGPLDLETFWDDTIQAVQENEVNTSSRLRDVFEHGVFTFNVGSSTYQSLLNQKYINPGDDSISLPTGVNTTDIMTSDLLTFLRTDISSINTSLIGTGTRTLCEVLLNNVNDPSAITATATSLVNEFLVALCNQVRDNTAWKFIDTTEADSTELQLQNPIVVCYSETDEVYSSNHYTDMNTTIIEELNLYERFTGPESATDLNVGAGTSHDETLELCIIRPMLFLSLQGYVPPKLEDRPTYLAYYNNPDGQCNAATTLPDGVDGPSTLENGTMNPTTDDGNSDGGTVSAPSVDTPSTPGVSTPTTPTANNAPTILDDATPNAPTSSKASSPSASPPTTTSSSTSNRVGSANNNIWFELNGIRLSMASVFLLSVLLI
jgi:hypothetical protein